MASPNSSSSENVSLLSVADDKKLANTSLARLTKLKFAPTENLLAVGAWDGSVRIYDVDAQGHGIGKAGHSHSSGVLDIRWSDDGARVLSGACDGTIQLFDTTRGEARLVGRHEAGVRGVAFAGEGGSVVVGASWDKTVLFWDLRTRERVGEVQLIHKCTAFDVTDNQLVLAMMSGDIWRIDPARIPNFLAGNSTLDPFIESSPITMMASSLACLPNRSGYLVGSIAGDARFRFPSHISHTHLPCHRLPAKDENGEPLIDCYPVNTLRWFSPRVVVLGGSEGCIKVWDNSTRDLENRLLFQSPTFDTSVVSLDFNHHRTWMAYAVAYDWALGRYGNQPGLTNNVFLHRIKAGEFDPRA